MSNAIFAISLESRSGTACKRLVTVIHTCVIFVESAAQCYISVFFLYNLYQTVAKPREEKMCGHAYAGYYCLAEDYGRIPSVSIHEGVAVELLLRQYQQCASTCFQNGDDYLLTI